MGVFCFFWEGCREIVLETFFVLFFKNEKISLSTCEKCSSSRSFDFFPTKTENRNFVLFPLIFSETRPGVVGVVPTTPGNFADPGVLQPYYTKIQALTKCDHASFKLRRTVVWMSSSSGSSSSRSSTGPSAQGRNK